MKHLILFTGLYNLLFNLQVVLAISPDMEIPSYNHTYLDITTEATPDPWITYYNNKFYLTFTANDRIPMWETSSLSNFNDPKTFQRWPVWHAPESGPQSERLWAPELHALRGRWYIYFAAADKTQGNRSHRMYVLGGPPSTQDPHQGDWELLGPIARMDQRQWAIDGTVFELHETLYFVYSGWPRKRADENGWEDRHEGVQQLFIIRLSDPTTADSPATMISHPSETWERLGGAHGAAINEGPQWLVSPAGHWRGLVYSCSGSWTKEYRMATLQLLGNGDPLDPAHWLKSRRPLLQNRADGRGPYGPGHASFLQTTGVDGETVAVFHATDSDTDGSSGRKARMQRVIWGKEGPDMGGEVGVRVGGVEEFLAGGRPAGEMEGVGMQVPVGGREGGRGLRSLVEALGDGEGGKGHGELR
ncbi:hypothetical protein LTR62_006182 [Meristemomyces frigidus]|uniref:Arabinanase/levansucrase/invertase n=1 Tax=Meristemomyces frigidus TaxID=1508187 RepID=A0AAN7TCT9_9PEZI|nr:hypothetical protein LTR62_006182 [Meristemomyces frigidus]